MFTEAQKCTVGGSRVASLGRPTERGIENQGNVGERRERRERQVEKRKREEKKKR